MQVRDYGDLSYLLKERYEASVRQLIGRAQLLPVSEATKGAFTGGVHHEVRRAAVP